MFVITVVARDVEVPSDILLLAERTGSADVTPLLNAGDAEAVEARAKDGFVTERDGSETDRT